MSDDLNENVQIELQDDYVEYKKSKIDDGKLIHYVSKLKPLYDQNLKEFRDNTIKDSCWIEISKKMGVSGNLIL